LPYIKSEAVLSTALFVFVVLPVPFLTTQLQFKKPINIAPPINFYVADFKKQDITS